MKVWAAGIQLPVIRMDVVTAQGNAGPRETATQFKGKTAHTTARGDLPRAVWVLVQVAQLAPWRLNVTPWST
jgi:hypothetical protein